MQLKKRRIPIKYYNKYYYQSEKSKSAKYYTETCQIRPKHWDVIIFSK